MWLRPPLVCGHRGLAVDERASEKTGATRDRQAAVRGALVWAVGRCGERDRLERRAHAKKEKANNVNNDRRGDALKQTTRQCLHEVKTTGTANRREAHAHDAARFIAAKWGVTFQNSNETISRSVKARTRVCRLLRNNGQRAFTRRGETINVSRGFSCKLLGGRRKSHVGHIAQIKRELT